MKRRTEQSSGYKHGKDNLIEWENNELDPGSKFFLVPY
jgi:hypothetical protein